MINYIEVDGNDGTGKTTRIEYLKKIFPDIPILDRGEFSKATLNEDIFADSKNWKCIIESRNFYNTIKYSDRLYIIMDADPEVCQQRIIARGDRIDVPYHNMDDLIKYHDRFLHLVDLCKDLPNVIVINTNDKKV